MENRAFLEMLSPARERVQKKKPMDICEKSGVCFDEVRSEFTVHSLGREIKVKYPSCATNIVLEESKKKPF